MVSTVFVTQAASVLGDTNDGLTGSEIIEICSAWAGDYGVTIPYSSMAGASNKRTALAENLKAFLPEQRFQIIKELCELEKFKTNKNVKDLKFKLLAKYPNLAENGGMFLINESLIDETSCWLKEYPDSLKLYEDALKKYKGKIFERNLLDDLRVSLEKLLKAILTNNQSLEKQIPDIGKYLKDRKCSPELNNMFVKLIDYYAKYQNTYVKHDDKVNENEIEIMFEMTSSFVKFFIRIS